MTKHHGDHVTRGGVDVAYGIRYVGGFEVKWAAALPWRILLLPPELGPEAELIHKNLKSLGAWSQVEGGKAEEMPAELLAILRDAAESQGEFRCPKCGGWAFGKDPYTSETWCNSGEGGKPLSEPGSGVPCGWKQ